MKNILFVGNYRSPSGWGIGTKHFLQAFRQIANVHARPIHLGGGVDNNIPDEIRLLEEKKYSSYDAVIQMVLPNFLNYNAAFGRNIGFSFFETRNIEHTGWVQRINMMDDYLVTSQVERMNLVESGVKIPIHVVGPTINVDQYQQSFDKIPELDTPSFKFYFIGEFNTRKNLTALLTAFHREFKPNENVDIVVKTSLSGMNDDQVFNMFNQETNRVKTILRLYPVNKYKSEIYVGGRLTDLDILKIHKSCDCLVCPSFGEALHLPALDALGMGNPSIVTNRTGMVEFVNSKNGFLIDSRQVPLLSATSPFHNIYNARETWQEPDLIHLQRLMRHAVENKNLFNRKRKHCLEDIHKYSYNKTAEKLGEILNV